MWLLDRLGRTGLDPKWVITPVGGIDKVPAFAALFGAWKNGDSGRSDMTRSTAILWIRAHNGPA